MWTRKIRNTDTFHAVEVAASDNPEDTHHEVNPEPNDVLGLTTMRR